MSDVLSQLRMPAPDVNLEVCSPLHELERYERPLPVMNEYDLLLDEGAEVAR